MKQIFKKIKETLEASDKIDLVIENEYPKTHFKCELYAYKKGWNLFLPYQDHLFFHNIDTSQENNRLEFISKLHNKARQEIDLLFKVPKIFIISVANISSIFISQKPFSAEEIKLSQENTRTLTGGEFHSIFLIDLQSKTIHCQGKSFTQIEGIKHHFKKVDPQNRSYYLITKIFENITKESSIK
ncbi:Uncharacterised protein [Candidatus Venteria ishoeyi]|uniref:Uncharacterized protein n=2 Tax=Candidatus Venteria ishoeyi TaxID=1899563 RepID=A0A1H6F592_9GAMM|nr:Uncharacterised protein [Candidatus Venteria ishoeyi]